MYTDESADRTDNPPVLIIDRQNLDVRHASPQAAVWLGLPTERLLGRSLLLSVPPLGQALTLAISAGLGPQPVALHAPLSTNGEDGRAIMVTPHARQRDGDILIELRPTSTGVQPTSHDLRSLQISMGSLSSFQTIRRQLADLRARIPWSDALARGDDPLLFLLWQAETSLAELAERYPALFASTAPDADHA